MKRRLLPLLLTALLALSLAGQSVWAAPAQTGSADHFAAVLDYDGRFADVTADSWYYDNVVRLYEMGLARGRSDTLFGAADSVTVAEAVGFAARIHSLYWTGDAESGPAAYGGDGGRWYDPYVRYLKAQGVIDSSFDALLDRSATRAQAAHIMSRTLPAALFEEINATAVTVGYATRSYITDVNDYTPYQQDILQLYRWGVVTGSDAAGSFLPDTAISRSEFCALLTRLVDPALRVTLRWDTSAAYSAEGTAYEDLVEPGLYRRSHSADDLEAIDSNLRHMLATGSDTITLQLTAGAVTADQVSQLMGAYLTGVRHYIEQGYNAVSCSYSSASGRVSMRFYSSIFAGDLFDAARSGTLEQAIRVHDQLWADGTITAGMSQTEKARAYYTWVCDNCAYDFRAVENSPSHTAYSLFFMGSAVCDGYTAAYNLLLKLEGISCTTWSTADHIWTVAQLDGQTVHIDTTWGDQSGAVNYRYFAMSEAESLARF